MTLPVFASALLAAGVTCLALSTYQDHQTSQHFADRDAALARCAQRQKQLECQQLGENAYHEQRATQVVRAGSFEVAGWLLLGLWGGQLATGVAENPLAG